MEKLYFKPLKFNHRAGKYTVNAYYIDLICRKGNLQDILLKRRVIDAEQVLFENCMKDEMWKDKLSEPQKIEKIGLLKKKMEERHAQEVANFLPILFNQSLVMLCTVFETFLTDSLKVITTAKPETMKMLSGEKDITISKIIDTKDYQDIFNIIQEKILKRFEFKSVDKKFNTFEILGLKKDLIFTLNEKVRSKYPDAHNLLIDIYKKRNNIVHKDELPLKLYKDLSYISEFLFHLTLKLAIDMKNHFNIPIDIQLTTSGQKIDFVG